MMRYLFKILISKRVEILISILFLSILFNNKIGPIILVVLMIIIFLDKKNYRFEFTKKSLLSITFFVYLVVRELFDIERKKGFDYIIRLLPLLVLVISLGLYKFRKDQIRFILNSFIWINYVFYISAILFGLYLCVINYTSNRILDFSFYQWTVPIKFDFHPPYWGILIILSVLFVLLDNQISKIKKYTFISISFLFLLLLSSRTALLSFIVIIILKLVYNKSIKLRNKLALLISFLLMILSFTFTSPYLSKKIQDNSGFQDRVKLWDATKEAIMQNYLFGNSISQSESKIKSIFDLENPNKKNYDPHNQFLFFGVSVGIFGLLLFVITMFYNEYYYYGFVTFIIVMIISFMTESVLNRQMGVMMYALFFNLITNKSIIKYLSEKT